MDKIAVKDIYNKIVVHDNYTNVDYAVEQKHTEM